MEPKSPQFTAYDFLGYLVPGLTALGLIDITLAYHSDHSVISTEWLIKRYSGISWQGAIPLLLISYYVGHLVSFVSSCTIEKHATWFHGHPTKFLMYSRNDGYFNVGGARPWLSWLLRSIIFLFMLPCSWIEIIFGKLAGLSNNYFRPFDPMLREAASGAFADLHMRLKLGDDLLEQHPSDYDYERLGLHYALETAPAHIYTLRNYVVLYGFLRSMTFVILIGAWVLSYHIYFMHTWKHAAIILMLSGLPIFISYAAFLKFLVRYHREAIMAIIAVFAKSSKNEA
jgi:hypothetical protein